MMSFNVHMEANKLRGWLFARQTTGTLNIQRDFTIFGNICGLRLSLSVPTSLTAYDLGYLTGCSDDDDYRQDQKGDVNYLANSGHKRQFGDETWVR